MALSQDQQPPRRVPSEDGGGEDRRHGNGYYGYRYNYGSGGDDDDDGSNDNATAAPTVAPVGGDRMPDPTDPAMGSARRRVVGALRRESFIVAFATSDGPPQILLLILLLALGFGSTIGVVPAVMSDRYARLQHGYDGELSCSDYSSSAADKPDACYRGYADAQNAVAYEQLASNLLTFFTSSLVGSLSDEYGRKGTCVRVGPT